MTVPPAEAQANPMHILAILWLIGMAAMLSYMVISYIRVRRRMQTATKIQENVYESELAETPFVLGILQPRIYLPYAVREADRRYILAHETAHIRHCDHVMKPFAFALLALVLCIAAAVCLLSDPKTDGKHDRSGEVILAEADVDGDGAEETLSYQKLGDESDGPAYLLHITKSDGTELWTDEEYLSESHAGWIAYFLYRDDEGYAILDYSPWTGQGLAAYSYKLYRFEGADQKIAQEGSVDFAMPKNAEDTWPPEAVAFADEVNALLDHSTLLISTIGGELRIGEDTDLWKCGPE